MKITALLISLFILILPYAINAASLQETIDSAVAGSTIILDDGVYEGSVRIHKNLKIKGRNSAAHIRGLGNGSVISIEADNVVIENITVSGSGENHESIDSCIAVKNSQGVRVLGNKMNDCLFGVNFENSNRGIIEKNNITSKNFSLGLKGDGVRLWYSHSNLISENDIHNVRDVVFWYSSGNKIEENNVKDSRYALHFMYADNNMVAQNIFTNNSVGIFFMYTKGSSITANTVINSSGAFGIGIGFKEVSDCVVENNKVIYNARGFYLDQSPYQPNTTNRFSKNQVFYNTVGIQLHGVTLPSIFTDNIFNGNIEAVSNDTPSTNLSINKWEKNFWDDYEGFDRDKDGFGDVAYEQIVYADKVMQYKPALKFFYASPVITIVNFLSKLLPFSDPEILAQDLTPRMKLQSIKVN